MLVIMKSFSFMVYKSKKYGFTIWHISVFTFLKTAYIVFKVYISSFPGNWTPDLCVASILQFFIQLCIFGIIYAGMEMSPADLEFVLMWGCRWSETADTLLEDFSEYWVVLTHTRTITLNSMQYEILFMKMTILSKRSEKSSLWSNVILVSLLYYWI